MPIDAVREAVAEAMEETGYEDPGPQGYAEVRGPAPAQAQDEEDDGPPTTEDLAQIEQDPRAKEAYRKIVRGYREKDAATEAQREAAEQALEAAEALRNHPQQAVRAIAKHLGVRVDERTSLQKTHAKMVQKIGREAADILAPLLTEAATEIAEETVGPLRQHVVAQEKAAYSAALQDRVTKFSNQVRAAGGEFSREIEAEMVALMDTVRPGPNATMEDYLEILHNKVMAARGRSGARRSATAERGAAPRAGMDPREAVRLAVAAARRQVRGR